MHFTVLLANDGNATPGWIVDSLVKELTIDEIEAFKVVVRLQNEASVDITSFCSNSPVEDAYRLCLAGLVVHLRRVNHA